MTPINGDEGVIIEVSETTVNGQSINRDATTPLATTTATVVSDVIVSSIRTQTVVFTATMTVTDIATATPAFTPSSITAFTPPPSKTVTVLSMSYSVLTVYDRSTNSTACSRSKTNTAVIAGSFVGCIAVVVVVVLLFVLRRRRKSHKRVTNNALGDSDIGTTSVPSPTLSPILTSTTRAESVVSELSDISRRLSQSSRTAYEEEIGHLRQRIRYMEEEMELTYSGSAPPSYRSSRRSDVSDPVGCSSSPPPPLPSREIAH
ncbi:hypothetical protein F5146DRAFT_1143945 [Armillaria mellea]|nr:hypothetical protein F5146DRAFT_1143945 [Armillaria mellea]